MEKFIANMELFLCYLFPSLRKGPRFKQTWKVLQLVANTNHVATIKTWRVIMDLVTPRIAGHPGPRDTDIVDHPTPRDTKKLLVILDLTTSRYHGSSWTMRHQDIMDHLGPCNTKTSRVILVLTASRLSRLHDQSRREEVVSPRNHNTKTTRALWSIATPILREPHERIATPWRNHPPRGTLKNQIGSKLRHWVETPTPNIRRAFFGSIRKRFHYHLYLANHIQSR